MPVNDAAESVIAANGGVSLAPVGTTLPTDATSPLDAAFLAVGYINEDGVSFSPNISNEGIMAWQSLQPIRYTLTEYLIEVSFVMHQWNELTLKLAFGGGDFTDNVGSWDFLLPKPGEIAEQSMVIDGVDGTKNYRIVLDRVILQSTEEITFQRGDTAGLGVTLQTLSGLTEGRPGAIYSNADLAAPAAMAAAVEAAASLGGDE